MFLAFGETMFSDRKSEKDPYWNLTASSYLTGLSLLQAELLPEKECTINHLYDLHIQGDKKYGCSKYIKEFYCRPGAKESSSYKLAAPAINAPNDTQGGLYSVYTSCLTPFILNEDIMDATANSTFDVRDLVEKKCAIFIITKDEGSVYNKLISASIDQMYERLIDIAEEENDGRLPRVKLIRLGSLPSYSSSAMSINLSYIWSMLAEMSLLYTLPSSFVILHIHYSFSLKLKSWQTFCVFP